MTNRIEEKRNGFEEKIGNTVFFLEAKFFDKMNSDDNARIEGVSDDSIVISSDEDNITLLVVGRMQTDEQREAFKQFSEDDMVIVKGTITDINESAFFMDIDDIG